MQQKKKETYYSTYLQYKNINIKHIWNASFFTSNETDRVPWS